MLSGSQNGNNINPLRWENLSVYSKMPYLHGIALTLALQLFSASCLLHFPRNRGLEITQDPSDRGDPLVLTPYIKEGKLKEARELATVKFDEFQDVESYSGFLTVDENYNSNLFFWFFPSKTDYKNDPVVLWLQGGPGTSSMFGLFTEHGPFVINENGGTDLRNYSWTENHSVIYIDNPVGTGFSFTDGGYAQNQTIIGEALYTALLQFFQLFSELQENEFFVVGESYGGKYAPAISYAIHKHNPSAKQKINLQGIGIGDGSTDPEHMRSHGDYLYQIGLIDYHAKLKIRHLDKLVVKHIKEKKWKKAKYVQDKIYGVIKHQMGHKISMFNYISSKDDTHVFDVLDNYLQRSDIKSAIHVGNITFSTQNSMVFHNLNEDYMQSVSPWVSTLLSHYRTMFYNGQLDIIVAYPLTINYLRHLKFSAADEYKTAKRHQWIVGNNIAGYVKQAGNLTEVLVRNAGHMVPGDAPEWGLDLITKFTRNQPLY